MRQSRNLIEALDRLSEEVGEPIEKIAGLIGLPGGCGPQPLPVFEQSISDPREHVKITYTVGTLKFAKLGKELYGLLDMCQYDLDGKPNGWHKTVWQPLKPPNELVEVPFPDFKGPFDRPSPLPFPIEMRAHSKAVWHFRDGSEIRATGPANSMIVPFSDKSNLFCVSVAAILTGGTKQYEGCKGVKTALGSSFLEAGVPFEEITDGREIGGVTVEAFRIVQKSDM